ncbi:MAG: ComEC/Rec2 family competence protein [Bacteroidales bacterium]
MDHLPVPKLVIPFAAGIGLWLQTGLDIPLWIFGLIYAGLGLTWVGIQCLWPALYSGRWVFGAFAAMFLLAAGYHLCQENNGLRCDRHFSKYQEKEGLLILWLKEPVAEKPNSFQAVAKVKGLYLGTGFIPVTGNIMVYLARDSLAASLRYGDVIILENRYDPAPGPGNPAQFDYGRFLSLRNIHHTTYRASGDWVKTGENRGSRLMSMSFSLRERALKAFSQSRLEGRELAVISALFLGYRESLDEDLRREYAGAGAMHILCVSGLHVGIIYLVLRALLSFFGRAPAGGYLQTVLILAFIWFYAAITGFSPSVLRAATMFSFVAAGESFRRKTCIYNTLSASAFVLLAANPFILSRIGFQLSYLAVFSIVTVQPWLYGKLKFRNRILDKVWAILTVSISAQLATGPLALHYFNQFPNYFLLTNVLVIPLASLIIYAAMLCLAFSFFPPAALFPGLVLSHLLTLLNAVVGFVEGLPFSVSSAIYLSPRHTLLVLIIFWCAGRYLIYGRRSGLLWSLALATVLMGSVGLRRVDKLSRARFLIYDVSGATAIDFYSPLEHVFLACTAATGDPRLVARQAGPNRIREGPRPKTTTLSLGAGYSGEGFRMDGPMVFFHGWRFLFIYKDDQFIPRDIEIDFLVVSGNPQADAEEWLDALNPSLVILDGSNSFWLADRWATACQAKETDCWVVRDLGAYARGRKLRGRTVSGSP